MRLVKVLKKDSSKVVEMYERGAKTGDPKQLKNLARCYELGEGVEKSFKEAKRLYKIAADKGDREAKELLAILRERGDKEKTGDRSSSKDVYDRSRSRRKKKPWQR